MEHFLFRLILQEKLGNDPIYFVEVYPGLPQISNIKRFTKLSILDACRNPGFICVSSSSMKVCTVVFFFFQTFMIIISREIRIHNNVYCWKLHWHCCKTTVKKEILVHLKLNLPIIFSIYFDYCELVGCPFLIKKSD